MTSRLRRLILSAVWLGLGGMLRAELTLVCRVGERTLPVAGIQNGSAVVMQDGRKIAVPADAGFLIEGEFKAGMRLAGWSSACDVYFPDGPDRRRGEMRAEGTVGISHFPVLGRWVQPSELLETWPEAATRGGIVVAGWLVRGKITQVHVEVTPPGTRKNAFVVQQVFHLSREELEGQGIQFFWADGKFAAPAPRFKDAAAQQALEAMLAGDAEEFRAALARLKQVDARDRTKRTLLHFAAEAEAMEAMELLLARGAKPGGKSSDGTAPLHAAARKGRQRALERLLAAGADVNGQTDGGQTPLLEAVLNGHQGVARTLLAAKANVEAADASSRSPITEGIDQGYADLVLLMAPRMPAVFWKGEQMPQVLVTQAFKGHTAMVRFLVEKGVSATEGDRGQTALMAGATPGDRELAEVLLRAGAPVNATDAEGRTALLNACQSGSLDYAATLLEAGADARRRSAAGLSCLGYAALRDAPELIELLLAHGSELSAGNAEAIGALDLALLSGSTRAARTLVARGAKLNLESKRRDLLLALAVQLDLGDVVAAALAGGWPADSKFYRDWPALHVAEMYKAQSCVALLHAAGAHDDAPGLPPLVALRELDARPKLIAAVDPEDPRDVDGHYPAADVEVDVLLDGEGRVLFPRMIAKEPNLALATLEAVAQWRFAPVTRGGVAACVRVVLPVGFPSSEERAMDVAKVDQAPQLVHTVQPIFPAALRGEGRINARFTVNTEGHVRDVRVIGSSNPAFDGPVVMALAKWTFKPGRRDGKPVNTRLEQPIVFSLKD